MRFALPVYLGLLILVAGESVSLAGLTVNGYSAATADRYDRFNNSANFLGNPHDWSGIGRTSSGRWGTLISPSFVIGAAHFPPELGTSIRFYSSNDPAGGFVDRTIGASVALTQLGFPGSSDLVLTQLSAPVTGINIYPIAAPMSPASLIGQEIYVWGQADTPQVQTAMRLGRNEVFNVIPALNDRVSVGSVFVFDYNTTTGLGPDESRVVTGDSGAPSFLMGPDGPAIVGIHWFNTVPADNLTGNLDGSGDTLVSSFISELNNAMAATGSSQRVMVSAVPEPAAGMLLALGALVTLIRRRPRWN
jgi:hypothetical protein